MILEGDFNPGKSLLVLEKLIGQDITLVVQDFGYLLLNL